MTVLKDLVAAHSISFDGEGHSMNRVYLVDGVGGTAESKLYNAITTAGIPQYNDPHPIIPKVVVTKIAASPEGSGSQIRVTVTYSLPDPSTVATTSTASTTPLTTSISTGLTSDQVYRDINGDFMVVTWLGAVIATRYVSADVQKPQISVSFKRTETSIPKTAIANFLGKTNSVPWSGFPAKTWLCTQINATEDKAGEFNVDYSFSYNPEDWRVEVYLNLTQAQIDELPPDVDTGNGYGVFDVYKTADFNILGLDF